MGLSQHLRTDTPAGGHALWRLLAWVLPAAAMAAGTMAAPLFGLTSSFLLGTGIGMASLGLVVSTSQVLAGLLSPPAGRVCDRYGWRVALPMPFLLSSLGCLAIILARDLVVLYVAAVLFGVANSFSNPAGNAFIHSRFPRPRWAAVVGVKHAGVQMGVVTLGFGFPLGVALAGWRPTIIAVAGLLLLLLAAAVVLGRVGARMRVAVHDESSSAQKPSGSSSGPAWAPRPVVLASYGAMMGAAGAILVTYVTPWVTQTGVSAGAAGLFVAAIGVTGTAGRLVWPVIAVRMGFRRALLWIASGAGLAMTILAVVALRPDAGMEPVLLGCLFGGFSVVAWNGVVMLHIVRTQSDRMGLRAGVVQRGFLIGSAVGPSVAGFMVESTMGFASAWLLAASACAVAFALAYGSPARLASSQATRDGIR